MALYVPPTEESDHKKQNQSLQLIGGATTTNTTNIATNTSNIATNTANIATNTANIATNTAAIALALASATFQGSPSNPTGTSSATDKMMGIGTTCKITPVYSGRVRISLQGYINVVTSGLLGTIQIRYGTGTAPSNADAVTGTAVGSKISSAIAAANTFAPFNVGGIITGLALSTQIWIDAAVSSTGGGTTNIASLSCDAFEI